MKVLKWILVFFLFLIASGFISNLNPMDKQHHSTEKAKPGKWLRHVVLLKFKAEASADDIRKVEEAFRALPTQIKEIKGLEWGTNNSPENLAQGFTHCFFLSFANEKGRATYLPHPAHQAFVAVLKPHLDKALVVDYWATN